MAPATKQLTLDTGDAGVRLGLLDDEASQPVTKTILIDVGDAGLKLSALDAEASTPVEKIVHVDTDEADAAISEVDGRGGGVINRAFHVDTGDSAGELESVPRMLTMRRRGCPVAHRCPGTVTGPDSHRCRGAGRNGGLLPIITAATVGLGAFALAGYANKDVLSSLEGEAEKAVTTFGKLTAPDVLPLIPDILDLITPAMTGLVPVVDEVSARNRPSG